MDAREEKIRSFFPLVRRIARRIRNLVPGSNMDDLIGEGCVGLIRAVDSFDPRRGPTLEAYAARIIAGAMLNGLRRLDPVSERVRREVREADRERYTLAGERGSLPTQLEMEQRRPNLKRATTHAYRYTPLSLDAPLPIGENLSGDWTADPALLAADRIERKAVRAALEKLSARLRFVVTSHYFQGKSLHDIGVALNVSPQRASQLHLAALKHLQKAMHAAPMG